MPDHDPLSPAESNAGQDYTRAMETPAEYVFSPGTGATPPALTGREEEQSVLSRCLAAMASGKAPAHDVVLVGPRGNGKKVLLNWFATACRASRRRVDALTLTPSDIADRQALMEALAPRRALARLLPRARPNGRVGSLLRKLLAVISLRCDGRSLAAALAARCRRRPLAVLLDEAHTLNIEVGGALLNASQQARATAPFLLVLAGTPGLPRRLDAMDASFWGRLADGLLGIGRLSANAAKEALTKPLLAHDVSIEADALAQTAEHSQCYPYFIQLWGDALWKQHLATGDGRLTADHVAAALPHVATRVTNYYQGRFAELEAGGLMTAATAVAPLFQAGPNISASNQEIDTALAAAGIEAESDLFRAREGLNDLGYIWRPPGQLPPVGWQAGIPSLMTHVLAHAPSSAGTH